MNRPGRFPGGADGPDADVAAEALDVALGLGERLQRRLPPPGLGRMKTVVPARGEAGSGTAGALGVISLRVMRPAMLTRGGSLATIRARGSGVPLSSAL